MNSADINKQLAPIYRRAVAHAAYNSTKRNQRSLIALIAATFETPIEMVERHVDMLRTVPKELYASVAQEYDIA